MSAISDMAERWLHSQARNVSFTKISPSHVLFPPSGPLFPLTGFWQVSGDGYGTVNAGSVGGSVYK